MTETAKIPRRKRFQFSLRTLMLCVLAYGGLWVTTIKWGGAELTRQYANENGWSGNVKSGDTSIVVKSGANAIRGYAVAPSPFVLYWRWEWNGKKEILDPSEKAGACYFWLFRFFPASRSKTLREVTLFRIALEKIKQEYAHPFNQIDIDDDDK